MDDFVQNLLTEWDLSEYIEQFKDHEIGEESLYLLDDEVIKELFKKIGPRQTFKEKLKLLKEAQNATNQVSTTGFTGDQGQKRAVPQEESYRWLTPTKKRREDTSDQEKMILSEVENIMMGVHDKLTFGDKTELNAFLKDKIKDLKIEKRELVGVFGRTGAGKSSLINAVIGEKDLLPTGDVSACTTVMIKVEANTKDLNYEAEIEFITKEEWKHDLWFLKNFVVNGTEDERDTDDYNDAEEQLGALYGKDWENIISQENPWDDKRNKEVRELIMLKKKNLACQSAAQLSKKLVRFTRTGSNSEDDTEKWFWPLVKCVTVRVPNNSFLQHVTLVDLPGSGDCNKSRDKMWKEVVGDCSTVWIVADINRAASDKEPWEILKNASNLMGNGGQCQKIHFICTKSDSVEDLDELSAEAAKRAIHDQNVDAKSKVGSKFDASKVVNRYFSRECFKVFTVSSKEFLRRKHLERDETEIPRLQEYLQNLNDCHSETLNYVSEAKGILALVQGARQRAGADIKATVCQLIEKNLSDEHDKVKASIKKSYDAFRSCLDKGVENSISSCEQAIESFLYDEPGRSFHRTLKGVVTKDGVHKTNKGVHLNLNKTLVGWLTDSIDDEFRETFPNESKREAFNGAISSFSLNIIQLIESHKNVELQLIYLKTEEEKLKTKLKKTIQQRKKEIYNSLMTSIEETMQPCYNEAKRCRGTGSLERMRTIITHHVESKKNEMFEKARISMMRKLDKFQKDIRGMLKETMQKSINLSLRTEDQSLPDVTEELENVTKYYDQLTRSSDADADVW